MNVRVWAFQLSWLVFFIFTKYSCTNIFHWCRLYTFYWRYRLRLGRRVCVLSFLCACFVSVWVVQLAMGGERVYIYIYVCMLFSVFQAGCVSIQELNAISDKRVSACFCFVLFFYALYNVRDGGYVTCLSTKCRVWSARSIPHTAHTILGRFGWEECNRINNFNHVFSFYPRME